MKLVSVAPFKDTVLAVAEDGSLWLAIPGSAIRPPQGESENIACQRLGLPGIQHHTIIGWTAVSSP